MADTTSWHMQRDESDMEPEWITELRGQVAATLREYHEADQIIGMVIAPDVIGHLEFDEVNAFRGPDPYWPRRELPSEDMTVVEGGVMAIFPLH